MRLHTAGALALLLSAGAAAAQDPYAVAARAPAGFDRAAAARDTRGHLERLIALNTQNPPGNEVVTAAYFDSVFRAIPGVETRVLPSGEGRANFIARLRAGRPTQRPLLIMGHMDVVGADTARWDTDPFVATERDGYLYGRGAIDDKGMLSAALVAMQQLAPQRARLRRDIIFLATAAEEGGPEVGIAWVLEHHRDLIGDAEFALNEGGRVRLGNGRVRTVNIQTTEKVPYNVVATATGPSGHASVPLPDNALAALARAVGRVHEWRAPARLNETTRLYFQRLATIEEDPERKAAMERLTAADASREEFDRAVAVLSRDILFNAVLRSGASLTLLNGGFRSNVIPADGKATFNLRVLPDEDVPALVAAINQAAAEPSVRFELDRAVTPAPAPSPVTTALFRAMESSAQAMSPGVTVLPFMSTGATDGAALREIGIPTYGILPFPLAEQDELRMHGDNERVPVAALGWAAEYLYRILAAVSR